MRIGKIGVAVISLVPFNVYGECTPTPDCASIGYTETSCEGDYLACPFDSTKLKCTPCDSSFRYDCSGDNITAGIGSTCGGKYAHCKCSSSDYVFSNGQCVCDPSCKVGAIYYSDGTCSACRLENKNPVGVVVKDNELVMSAYNSGGMHWSENGVDLSELDNYESSDTAMSDFDGKNNTQKIVNYYGTEVDVSSNAAVYCYNYAPYGLENSKGKWYLPAFGELYSYLQNNYYQLKNVYISKLGWEEFTMCFWSSTEYNSETVWVDYPASWYKNAIGKSYMSCNVGCFLTI